MSTIQPLPLIDIGANLSHESFQQDMEQVIEDAKAVGITQILVTGTSVKGSQNALALAREYAGFLFCTAGIHPHEAAEYNQDAAAVLMELLSQHDVLAAGEAGLDYCRDYSPRHRQREAFAGQLELAATMNKPAFLHQRDSHDDFIAILRKYRDALPRAVVHCFTGTEAELRDYLDLDLYIGITGWICDERRGHHLHDIVSMIPENRLMLETDAPYLLPRTIRPHPKSRRNVPANIRYVLSTVAECLGFSEKKVAEFTSRNAGFFFNL